LSTKDLHVRKNDGVIQQMKNMAEIGRSLSILVVTLMVLLSFHSTVFARNTLTVTAQKYYYGVGAPKSLSKAFKLYLKAARGGDVDAMFIVGGMYMQGQGTNVNTAEAFQWLYSAAVKGRSTRESERILANSFITGQNVPQNYEEARHWYERAAQGGDVEAQSELGYMYFTGKNVEKDYKKAHDWFEIAARNNYALAQYNMGILWYTGNGVSGVDIEKSYAWFNLAGANGHASGRVAKQFLETVLSADELQRAQRYSQKLYEEIRQITE